MPISVDFPFVDKLEHLAEYFVFGMLLMRAFNNPESKLKTFDAFAWTVIIAFLYGISDEIHQAFVLGRSADIFDALLDLMGASFGSYIYLKNKHFLKA